MKYKKKPVVIDAYQWFKNGDHPDDDCFRPFEDTGKTPIEKREGKIVRYFRHPAIDGLSICDQCGLIMHVHGFIDTLEGGHRVCPGDWIITGVKGERYPCKPNIFELTYEKAEDAPQDTVERAVQPTTGPSAPVCPRCGEVLSSESGFNVCNGCGYDGTGLDVCPHTPQ